MSVQSKGCIFVCSTLYIVHFTLIFNSEFMDASSILMVYCTYVCDHHAIVAVPSSFHIKTYTLNIRHVCSLWLNKYWHGVSLNVIKVEDSLNTNVILITAHFGASHIQILSLQNELIHRNVAIFVHINLWRMQCRNTFSENGEILMLTEREVSLVC